MAAWPLLLGALMFGQSPANSPPLTRDQYDKVRELIQVTQRQETALKAELDKCQRELVRHYGEFELNVEAVRKLQTEVIDLQRKLLTNYHTMQVELRALVDKERFQILHRRIGYIIEPPLSKPAA